VSCVVAGTVWWRPLRDHWNCLAAATIWPSDLSDSVAATRKGQPLADPLFILFFIFTFYFWFLIHWYSTICRSSEGGYRIQKPTANPYFHLWCFPDMWTFCKIWWNGIWLVLSVLIKIYHLCFLVVRSIFFICQKSYGFIW
jgi:hypothetical protein